MWLYDSSNDLIAFGESFEDRVLSSVSPEKALKIHFIGFFEKAVCDVRVLNFDVEVYLGGREFKRKLKEAELKALLHFVEVNHLMMISTQAIYAKLLVLSDCDEVDIAGGVDYYSQEFSFHMGDFSHAFSLIYPKELNDDVLEIVEYRAFKKFQSDVYGLLYELGLFDELKVK